MVIEKIEVKSYSDETIITKSIKDLERLYELINSEKDIIISWVEEDGQQKSKIVSKLMGSFRNGTLSLGSEMKTIEGGNK